MSWRKYVKELPAYMLGRALALYRREQWNTGEQPGEVKKRATWLDTNDWNMEMHHLSSILRW